MPSPDLLQVFSQVFEHEGRPLHRIALAELGPTAEGVALSSLPMPRPTSLCRKPCPRKFWAILVLGHLPPGVAALATGEVRFQARWKLFGDPLLVLLQIGEKLVTKAEPAQRTLLTWWNLPWFGWLFTVTSFPLLGLSSCKHSAQFVPAFDGV